jgi:MoaA/NifB/PqqE/SkfB family radical SAM enzyme
MKFKEKLVDILGKDAAMWLSRKIDYPLVPPDMLQLCFTFDCNIKCTMCTMKERMEEFRKQGRPYELSVPLMKGLIQQAKDMGIQEVFFVGGEPFILKEILGLVGFSTSLGMRTVITTNGVLVTPDKYDDIFNSGLKFLSFSIDGPDAESYEAIRGSQKVFNRVIENFRNIAIERAKRKATYPQLTVICTVMRQNIAKLPELVYLSKDMGADWVQFQPVVPDNTDQAHDCTANTWIGPDMYDVLDRSLDKLIELKNSGFSNYITSSYQQLEMMKAYFRGNMNKPRKCYIGFNRLMVTQDHKIYFCVADPKTKEMSFGDVTKTPLNELWKSRKARRFRKLIRKCERPCLLFCAYRPEFDVVRDSLYKIKDKLLKRNKR